MQPREVNREHANQYAQAKGIEILSEIKDGVVVKLKSGSISNISSKTIADHFNQQQQQAHINNGGSNLHSAPTDNINTILANESDDALTKLGIPEDIVRYADITPEQ